MPLKRKKEIQGFNIKVAFKQVRMKDFIKNIDRKFCIDQISAFLLTYSIDHNQVSFIIIF